MDTLTKAFTGERKKYFKIWADKYAKLLHVDRFHEREAGQQENIIADMGEAFINALRYYGSPDRSQWNDYAGKLRTREGREFWDTLKRDMDYSIEYYEKNAARCGDLIDRCDNVKRAAGQNGRRAEHGRGY